MMKTLLAATAVIFALLPLEAFAQARVSTVLSTTMQRTCQGETSQTVTFDATGQRPINQPQIERDTRTFRAAARGDGYAFEQRAITSAGDTVLRVDVAANGAISNAALSGAQIDAYVAASPTPVNLTPLAFSLAQEIPERLIVGRSFAVGDDYYPEDLRHTLIGQMTSAMGLPFPIQGTITMPYRGEIVEDGRRLNLFEGVMRMAGTGQMQGQAVSISVDSRIRVTHDAITGLVVKYDTSQNSDMQVAGQPYTSTQSYDNYVCQFAPQ